MVRGSTALLPLLWLFLLSSVSRGGSFDTTGGGICLIQTMGSSASTRLQRDVEQLEKSFVRLTGLSGSGAPPVVVSLPGPGEDSPGENVPRPSVDAMEGGQPRISLRISSRQTLQDGDRRGLLLALLLRSHYGSAAPEPGSPVASFPAWLTEGLGLLCSGEEDGKSMSPVAVAGSPVPLEKFLSDKPPDGSNRTLFALHERMAACLVVAGFKENPAAFRSWVASGGKQPAAWPDGWGIDSVGRRWNLIMASASAGEDPGRRVAAPEESLAAYDRLVGNSGTGPASFSAIADPKAMAIAGRDSMMASLDSLRLEANPLMLPLIDGTIRLLSGYPRISSRKLLSGLDRLRVERLSVQELARGISGYLDWYEAARLNRPSGEFDALLHRPVTPSRAGGPVGRYLDAIEQRGW